eukprot:2519375-Rhodomonas_salina.3
MIAPERTTPGSARLDTDRQWTVTEFEKVGSAAAAGICQVKALIVPVANWQIIMMQGPAAASLSPGLFR